MCAGSPNPRNCRHKIICNHFGERVPWENCEACDVCLPPVEWKVEIAERARRVAQKMKPDKGGRITVSREVDGALLAALKQWRLERSRADKVPAFVILHDSTLEHLCLRKPASLPQLRGRSRHRGNQARALRRGDSGTFACTIVVFPRDGKACADRRSCSIPL